MPAPRLSLAELFGRTVAFLLLHSGAADKAVRFRCCQLLGSLTTGYTQRPDVGEDDLEACVDVLLPRLRDKVGWGSFDFGALCLTNGRIVLSSGAFVLCSVCWRNKVKVKILRERSEW